MLNEQWLNTFLTLVEVEHFTLTADKLNMTQPGVSQHVKKLEEQVGRALLNRAGKKFELTQAGEMLYSYALKRRKEEEELFNQLEVNSEEEGPCKFSCSGAMATVLYPHFLKRQKKFPGLVVSVEAAPNKLIIDKVISNEIDVGIVTQSTVLSELSYESVGVEALCLVLPKKYSNKKLNFSDLDKIGFINHPDGPSYADRLLSANYGAEFKGVNKLNVRGYINQIGQIMLPVSEGLGFTILPESIVRHFRPQSSIFIAPLKVPVKDELFIVKKKYRSIGRRYEWFEKEIRNRISEK